MQKQRLNLVRTLLAVLVLLFTVSSVFFTAHEHFHDCSGEDCPICHVIQISEQNIKLFSFSLSLSAVAIVFHFMFADALAKVAATVFIAYTLISQKIRLND